MMFFQFLENVLPTWYFNLYPKKGSTPYLVDYRKLPEDEKALILLDNSFDSEDAKLLDAAFQAWHKGIIHKDQRYSLLVQPSNISIQDNYRFVRKYFHSFRIMYCLIGRLGALQNPVTDLLAFWSTRSVKRVKLSDKHHLHRDYHTYNSELLLEQPLVSIIIPTLMRYQYLKDVMEDLAAQDYQNFEIIVVDQTDSPDKAFYDQFNKTNNNIIFQDGKGQWLSRNEAIRQAKGDLLLFFDDDSRVDPNWITEHIKGLDYFNVDISAGVSISKTGGQVPESYQYFRWADQFDSGNALVKRSVFEKIGMFDRQFDKMRMGDGEFGLRAYLNGFTSISHPYAKRLHLKVDSGGLRHMGSWDAFRTAKLLSPKPIPSVLYLYRKYFPKKNVKHALILGVLPSLIPYKFKQKKYLLPIGMLLSMLMLPLLGVQVSKSRKISGHMLQEGDKIEWL